jgi:hypothetical protein
MYRKSTRSIFVFACLSLMLLFSLVLPHSANAASAPLFSLTSSTNLLSQGQNMTIDIHGKQITDLVAYELTLSFDPNLWEFVGAISELAGYKATPLQELHVSGIITFALAKMGQAAGENGSVNLGRITLKAKTQGTDRIQLTGVRLVNSQFTSVSYTSDTAFAVTINSANHGGPSSNGNPSGVNNDDNVEAHQQVLNAEELKPDASGKVIVEVADGKKEVLLSANTVVNSLIKKLEIRSKGITLAIDSDILKALSERVSGDSLMDAQILIRMDQALEEQSESLVSQGNEGIVTMKSAGAIYHVSLLLVSKDGKESKLAVFEQPVEITLAYDEGADESKLGIYYFNESTKAWEYVGGVVDQASQQIKAIISHFSTYAVLEYHKAFTDVPAGHWASKAIQALASKHVVSGVSSADYAPGKQVSRAEFAALMSRTLGLKAKSSTPFTDVDDKAWFADEVTAAYEAKLIAGKSTQSFAPNDFISREEMAAMLVRAYVYGTGKQATDSVVVIKDRESVSNWAIKDVDAVINMGLMSGTGGGKFAPVAFTTRAEAAVAVYNLLMEIE